MNADMVDIATRGMATRIFAVADAVDRLVDQPNPLMAFARLRDRALDKTGQQLPDAVRQHLESMLAQAEAAITGQAQR